MFSTALAMPSSIALCQYSRARRKLGDALSGEVHRTELAEGVGIILRRGLLEPWQRLRVVHIHTEAVAVHRADLILAQSVIPLGSDLERRHRSWVVDRRSLARVVDHANVRGCINVALARGERRCKASDAASGMKEGVGKHGPPLT